MRRSFQEQFPLSPINPLADYVFDGYSDEFLKQFPGVASLTILDYSAYEGANLIHDLNEPIPRSLCGRFDALIAGGSLEHVFNFAVAISNLMKMLKVGGNIFISTPANNLCGHGFYRFSPELMFRIFPSENGFESTRVAMFEAVFPSIELTSNRTAYEIADPGTVRSRVGFVTKGPVMMMVEARKITDVPPSVRPPLQSDYVTAWNAAVTPPVRGQLENAVREAFKKLPLAW